MTRDALQSADGGDPALTAVAERMRTGDREAFRELVARTMPRTYRVALRILGDADEADDVVQETYIRAWDRREELRDPSAVTGWLARVARNAARDRLRWWKRRPRASFDEASANLVGVIAQAERGPLPDEALASAQAGAALAREVAALPDKHRLILLLREADDMTYEEIAEALGIAIGTVESRLHRARAALARRLQRLAREGGTP